MLELKIRAGISAVEDVSNDKHIIKRHGKLEYVMDIDRSSEIESHMLKMVALYITILFIQMHYII